MQWDAARCYDGDGPALAATRCKHTRLHDAQLGEGRMGVRTMSAFSMASYASCQRRGFSAGAYETGTGGRQGARRGVGGGLDSEAFLSEAGRTSWADPSSVIL